LLGHQRIILEKIRGSKRLDDLTSDDIEDFRRWRVDKGATAQTVKHSLDLIRCAWKLAKRQGHRVSDLNFPSVKLPKGRMRYLTVEEERRLLAELDPAGTREGITDPANRRAEMSRMVQDAYELVILLLDTGARYGEIANIEWRQLELDARIIRLWRPKVQNESVLFMTGRVHGILLRRKADRGGSPYVFTNNTGGPRGYAATSIRKAMNRAGLSDCTIHTLRHTHATRLIQNGLSLYEVQAVLGHTDIKTTSRYAHLEQSKVTAKARDVIDAMNARAPGN
jgi:integrase